MPQAKVALLKRVWKAKDNGKGVKTERYVFEDVEIKRNAPVPDPNASAYYLRYTENGKQITKTMGQNLQAAYTEYLNRDMNLERIRRGLAPELGPAGLVADFRQNAQAMAPVSAQQNKTNRVWIKDAVRKYIDGIKRDVETGVKSKATLRGYGNAVERLHVHMDELGIKYMDEITGDLLKLHEAWMFKHVKKRKRGKLENTIAKHYRFLNTFFVENRINMTYGKGESGLLARHKVLKEKKKTIIDKYSEEEVNALLSVADLDEADLIHFFLRTGARDEEVQYMEWNDIDWKKGLIHIQEKSGVWKPKDKENREIPLNGVLRQRLEERRKRQRPASNLLFPNTLGTQDSHLIYHLHKLVRRLHKVGRGEEISGHPTLHRFRRTFATMMIKHSDFPTVMKLTGHSDPETLMRYLADDSQKKAAVASEAAFAGVGK